jgi:hypothetical protein
MRNRHTTAAATTAAALLLFTLTACAIETVNESSDSSAASAKSADSAKAGSSGQDLDVHQVASELNGEGQLGKQTEKPIEKSDHPNAEIGRIDTDRVIIYEMKSPEAAATRAKAMSEVSDSRPQHAAGRFVLSWRTDDVPSSGPFMDKINRQLDNLAAEEK